MSHLRLRGAVLRLIAGSVVALFLLWPAMASAELMVDDIAKELICQCGCTMVVSSCDCGTADQLRKEIKEKLEQGQSKEQLLAYYVEKYGETVLAAPTKQGFNLTAWITPFAAIAGGGGVVFVALRAWVSRRMGSAAAEREEALAAETPERLSEYEEQLQRDLEEEE